MGAHLIDGQFQSDKYPTTPRGKVPLNVKDASAQDLLWIYAQRRRTVDAEFADDLEMALRNAGYVPPIGLRWEIKDPKLHAAFQSLAPTAALPWRDLGDVDDYTKIEDNNGDEIVTVHADTREEAFQIVGMILVAVNTMAGFKAMEETQ